MKMIVCIKQVAKIYIQHGFDSKTNRIDPEGIVYIINPYDEIAVEEAIRIREKMDTGEVTLITMGASQAEEVLRWGIAMGADKAIHIVEDVSENIDPWMTSIVLSKVISGLEFDMVFFGKLAIDDEMGQVGAYVAESLNLPMVSSVIKLEFSPEEKKATVQRALERGNREVVECSFPAVFTVDKGLNRPRYPTFPSRKMSRTKPIQKMDIKSLGLFMDNGVEKQIHTIRFAPPKLRPKKILTPGSNLTAAGRMKWIMSGGVAKKKGGVVDGDSEKLVSGIIEFLQEKKIIKANI
ncbi:MAG: electron transfer flavoprotein subunit beta/FixA family protein [Dissulfuribacterales bacterium]